MSETAWYISPLIGFAIGTTDAYVNHPLWAIKTRQQIGAPFTLNPRILYRGVVAHAMSSVPMDMLQVTVSRLSMDHLFSKETSYTNKRLFGGLIGGAFAALISSPVELIMTRQQQDLSPLEILRKNPLRGFSTTVARDSIFCAGFFAGVPLLREKFEERKVEPAIAALAAGIFSGVVTAVISQPFDTLKSNIQASIEPVSHRSAIYAIINKSGYRGLFTGLLMRMARVTSGVLILGVMNDALEQTLIR